MTESRISRRAFLRLSAASAIGMAALAACGPVAPAQGPAQPAATAAAQPAAGEAAPAPTAAPASANTVKVTFWDPSKTESEIKALDKAYLGFNSAQGPAQVEIVHGKSEDTVLPAVAAANPPDVYWRWNANTFGTWINKKVVQDLTPFVQASKLDLKRFVPVSLTAMQWQGKYYGMPLTSAGVGLYFWSKPAFSKAGLDPAKPPASIEEAMAFSDKLTVRDASGNISKLGFHYAYDPTYLSSFFNGSFYDEKAGKVTPTDPGVVAAYQWSADWYKHFGIDATDRFLAGLPGGGGGDTYWSQNNPVCKDLVGSVGSFEWEWLFLTDVAGCQSDKFGMAPMAKPAGHPEYPSCSQGAIALVVPTGAAHAKEGWQFIEYLQGVEPTGIICAGLVNCAQIVDAVEYPAYRENPVLKLATEVSKNARAFPGYIPVASEYSTELDKARDLVVHGKATPQEALQGVYDRIQPALEQALKG